MVQNTMLFYYFYDVTSPNIIKIMIVTVRSWDIEDRLEFHIHKLTNSGKPKSGRTTRLVNSKLQQLFIEGETIIEDHVGGDRDHIVQIVVGRVWNEHRDMVGLIEIDPDTYEMRCPINHTTPDFRRVRSGRTTRSVDMMIHRLFQTGEVDIDNQMERDSEADTIVLRMKSRLKIEHPSIKYNLVERRFKLI
jgi:hypothetical protein